MKGYVISSALPPSQTGESRSFRCLISTSFSFAVFVVRYLRHWAPLTQPAQNAACKFAMHRPYDPIFPYYFYNQSSAGERSFVGTKEQIQRTIVSLLLLLLLGPKMRHRGNSWSL
jgi:hypothetical protein